MSPKQDYYQILGVSPDATAKDIKAAYRALAKKLHPDVGGSAEQLAAVNEAADVLTDPKRREEYDRSRGGGSAKAADPKAPPRPRQKVSVALCDFCGTMNRVKDDPDYVPASCGKCGRPLGKAGAAPSPPPSPPPPPAKPEAKPEDADSYAKIFADAASQLFGGGLKTAAKDLPGAAKVLEGLQEMADHLAQKAKGKGSVAEEAKSKLDEVEAYLEKIRKG